jgi:predicted transposase/invertase (TIGR01784 family)
MPFLDVKTDFAFKKVFGSPASKDILISFLNAVLDFGDNPIADLTIVNPYQMPLVSGLKDTYVDVKAKLKNGSMVIIEMQVVNHTGFGKRILFNWAKAYSTQLDQGHDYHKLKPVIALTITDFTLFEDTELESVVISYFNLSEKHHKVAYLEDDLELVFVELPKFDKTESKLSTITDKWIYFLKHAGDLKSIPQILGGEPAINQALSIANTASLTVEEIEVQESKLRWLTDQKAVLARALQAEASRFVAQHAAAEALAKLEKAEAEKQAALEKAENAEKSTQLQIATKMLQANVDIALIQQVTGLDEVSIKKLKA